MDHEPRHWHRHRNRHRALPDKPVYPVAGTRLGVRYQPWIRSTLQDATTIYLPFTEQTPELQVTATPSEIEAPADTVEFKAEAPGAILVEVLDWTWLPADSAQPAVTVPCSGRGNPCVIPVHESGEMKVTARVDGQLREATATVTLEDEQVVTLSCTPAVVMRAAGEVTCSPEYSGAGSFVVTNWRFEGTGEYADLVVVPAGPPQQEWKGLMVAGGKVTVFGNVAGRPDSASASVQVTATAWVTPFNDVGEKSQFITHLGIDHREEVPAIPTHVSELGRAYVQPVLDAGYGEFGNPTAVPSGPNNLLFYNADPPCRTWKRGG